MRHYAGGSAIMAKDESSSLSHQLAAILAADLVGYSGLMAGDEAGMLRRLKIVLAEIVQPAVAAHRGRVVKTTGDGVLAQFGSASTR
jgi:adenylate cyclase